MLKHHMITVVIVSNGVKLMLKLCQNGVKTYDQCLKCLNCVKYMLKQC